MEAAVLERVKDDFDSGRSLLPWEEDQRGLARRCATLERFIRKIGVAKPRPKKPPKLVIRAPKFRPGDCLSIQLTNGQYAAAIVLAADHSIAEYGTNLVAVLDYLSADRPTTEVFRKREWLVLTHHECNNRMDVAWYQPVGYRKAKDRLEVVGQIEILTPTRRTVTAIVVGPASVSRRSTSETGMRKRLKGRRTSAALDRAGVTIFRDITLRAAGPASERRRSPAYLSPTNPPMPMENSMERVMLSTLIAAGLLAPISNASARTCITHRRCEEVCVKKSVCLGLPLS